MSKKFYLIFTYFFLFFNQCFAGSGDEYNVIAGISNSFLSIIKYFAYAIAFGMLIFVGIKYVMSGANERANLKKVFPMYLIGFFIIVFGFSIITFVTDLIGNNKAEEVIDAGEKAGERSGQEEMNAK